MNIGNINLKNNSSNLNLKYSGISFRSKSIILTDNSKYTFKKSNLSQNDNISFNGLSKITKFLANKAFKATESNKKTVFKKILKLIIPAKKKIKPLEKPFITGSSELNHLDDISIETMKLLKKAGIDISDIGRAHEGGIDSISSAIKEHDVLDKMHSREITKEAGEKILDQLGVPYGQEYDEAMTSMYRSMTIPDVSGIADIVPKSFSERWIEEGMRLKEAGQLDEQIEFLQNNPLGAETNEMLDSLRFVRGDFNTVNSLPHSDIDHISEAHHSNFDVDDILHGFKEMLDDVGDWLSDIIT